MNIWDKLTKPIFVLAPMDDVTDTVFRQIIADCAPPDLYITEFVNADGLQSPGRSRLLKKLQSTDKEQPIIAQLWGKVPANYEKTAKEIVRMGFTGIDINMGCPVKVVMKNGCCSALIDNRDLAIHIISATKKGAGKLPLSVKTRLGINQIDFSWHELLLKQNLDALIIHGRTAKNMSDVPANWEAIGKIRELRDKIAPGTKIIGNGDVLTRQQGEELAKKYKLDGVMIGRGVFQDPFVFSKDGPWKRYTKEQKIDLYRRHIELFAKTWGHSTSHTVRLNEMQGDNEARSESYKKYAERAPKQATQQFAKSVGRDSGSARKPADTAKSVRTLNKFCKVYINGFDGAKEMRENLMHANSASELLSKLDKIKA